MFNLERFELKEGAATGSIIAGGLSAGQAIAGAIGKADAKSDIENYKRQELSNAYDTLQVSTMGADLQKEQAQLANASILEALMTGGVRSVQGGVGRVVQNYNTLNRGIAADLDRQQKDIDRMVASDDVRIRQMQEEREQQDLAGLGAEFDYQRDQTLQGFKGVAQGAVSAANLWGMDKEAFQQSYGNFQGTFDPLIGGYSSK